ncbi:MAG: hypothetical protein AB3N33_00650 [Puniceicoccaceae bacterium]
MKFHKLPVIVFSCLALAASTAFSQVVSVDFTSPAKESNGSARVSVGTGGLENAYDGFGTWVYTAGNMGINDAAEGNESGIGTGNAVSSIGELRVQDIAGTNARAAAVVFDGSLFTEGVQYVISFDVIGGFGRNSSAEKVEGTDNGRFWLAELSGYDDSGSNYVQIDGTWGGWGNAANVPFIAAGGATVNYLQANTAGNEGSENGQAVEGETLEGVTTANTNIITFTYTAGTDIGFAIGTYNNAFAIDNFVIDVKPAGPTTWAGYDIVQDGYVDTTPWLGWIWVTPDSPWVWSLSLTKYLYLPEEFVGESGAWMYIP